MRVVDSIFERGKPYDLFIATCGYEYRSSYLARLGVRGEDRIAIEHDATFGGSIDFCRDTFMASGWGIVTAAEAMSRLRRSISNNAHARVGVDISSMPRLTLAMIVEELARLEPSIDVDFVYAPGSFDTSIAADQSVEVLSAGPMRPFFAGGLRAPSTPIGVVLGLGIEPHRSLGVVELLEPARTWSFSARGGDERFVEALSAVNRTLWSSLEAGSRFQYDIRSFGSLYSALDSLVFAVGLDYRLILAPSGPKLFSLACLLVGVPRQPSRPAVWRVGAVGLPPVMDVEEAGDLVSVKVRF